MGQWPVAGVWISTVLVGCAGGTSHADQPSEASGPAASSVASGAASQSSASPAHVAASTPPADMVEVSAGPFLRGSVRANYYECGKKGTVPVGSDPSGASPFGAHDMAGNVWEWTADFHMAEYYVASPAKDPEGPSAGDSKVVRGGAFKYGASELLSAGRTFDDPTVHFEHVGVRCAKSKEGL